MIATISKGKGARGLLAYCVGDPAAPRGVRVAGNMAGRTIRELAAEFGLVRKMRPTLGRAIAHVSLSLPAEDRHPTPAEWAAMAESFIAEMGFTDCPWVAFEHTDTEHHHIHLAISRIRADGKVIPDAGDFRRAQAVSRRLEKIYGLTAVSSTKTTNPRRQSMTQRKEHPIPEADEIDPETSRFSRSLTPEAPEPDESIWAPSSFDEEITLTGFGPGSALPMDAIYRDALGTELDQIFRSGNETVLHLKPTGMIRDQGNTLRAFQIEHERAAALLVDLADAKGWKEINLTGPEPFVKSAMEIAVKRGMTVRPRDKQQTELLNGVLAARGLPPVDAPQQPQTGRPSFFAFKNKLAQRRAGETKKGSGSGSGGGQRPTKPVANRKPGGAR